MTTRSALARPRTVASRPGARRRSKRAKRRLIIFAATGLTLLLLLLGAAATVAWAQQYYTFTFRSPFRLGFQSPLVLEPLPTADEAAAEADQDGRRLTPYQAYACRKFGSACRVALAIQRAENLKGDCEIYHYNSNGTLDWGYFQINTVHLERPEVNLRDLLSCRANIDFAHQLYMERGFQPWSTYRNGAYKKFLHEPPVTPQRTSERPGTAPSRP